MRSRLNVYLDMLHVGVLNARRAAAEGDARQAFAEADHIHNLPDLLMSMDDEEKHRYYWEVIRPGYISISKPEWAKRFERLWRELEAADLSSD